MSTFSFLSADTCTFEGKKSYEQVLVLLRRHPIVLVLQLVAFLIIGLIPIFVWIGFHEYLAQFSRLFWFLSALWYALWWYGVFYAITMYLLDVWIVTDHRVIDSEQHGFFNRTVAEIHLSKIQDISVSIRGLIPTFFDFGDLEVQSAGATEKFFFKQIPHPEIIKDLIMKAHDEFIEIHPNDIEVHGS